MQDPPMPDPTPEEIAAATAEIRSRWSEDERLCRLAGPGRLCPDRRTPRQPAIKEYGTARDWSLELLG